MALGKNGLTAVPFAKVTDVSLTREIGAVSHLAERQQVRRTSWPFGETSPKLGGSCSNSYDGLRG